MDTIVLHSACKLLMLVSIAAVLRQLVQKIELVNDMREQMVLCT